MISRTFMKSIALLAFAIGVHAQVLHAQSGSWTVYNMSNSGLPGDAVRAMAQENDSVYWFGTTTGGLARFDGTTWTVYNTSNSGLPANEVRSILIDGHQKWVGTLGGGVAMYNDTTWTVYNNANSPLPSNNILCMAFDCADNLWIGATYGGATRFDRTNNAWVSYNTTNSGIISNNIRAIYPRDSADIWFGNLGGLSHFQNSAWTVYDTLNSPLPYNDVRDIKEDSAGNLWIGTYSGGGPTGGIVKYDGVNWTIYDTSNSSLHANSVGTILIDPCGMVWCGNAFMNTFDGSTWTMYDTTNSALPYYNVLLIFQDCSGDLWVSSWGVVRFHNDCNTLPDCNAVVPSCAKLLSADGMQPGHSGVSVYPNPATDNITVYFGADFSPAEVIVYAVTGERVWSGTATGSATAIDISGLANGSYFLEVRQGAEISRHSFVKL